MNDFIEDHSLKIAFIGNCQMMGMSYYMRRLPCHPLTFWVHYENQIVRPWMTSLYIWGKEQLLCNMYEDEDIMGVMNICNIFIYKPNYNTISFLNKYPKTNGIYVPLSPIFINRIDTEMARKERKYNINIKISSLIRQLGAEQSMAGDYKGNHPSSLLYLLIIKNICQHLGVGYYEPKIYDILLKQQYPKY